MTDIARLILDVDTLGLRNAERELNRFGGAARGVADIVQKAFAAIGVGLGIAEVIRINSEFGASMSKVAAISGATGAEFDKLREKALEMGAATQFSASQAADALGFLAMAGFSAAEAIEAIPDVLSLAAAAGMDLAEAADIASNVLSGFGKNAKDAGEVADVLAKAASVSNTNVSQLGQALSTAAPIAAALGISMEETAAAIGVMSDAGIQGERAGTALRGVFASLAGPTTQAREALAKYGLTAAQIDPQTVGLATAMATLRDANISTADAFVIFGREAASGALVMAETADRVRELTGQFETADGAASDMAATMRDNLQGDIQSLKSAVEGLVIALGDSGVTGAFRSMAQFATDAVRTLGGSMGTLINVVASAVTGLVAYRLTLLAANAVGIAATSTIVAQSFAVMAYTRNVGLLTAAKTGATVAARTLIGVLAANPFGAVAVAVGVLAGAMMTLRNSQIQAREETNNLINSLRGLAEARSADFAVKRAEAQIELSQARDQRSMIELNRNALLRGVGITPEQYESRNLTRLQRDRMSGIAGALRNINGQLAETGLTIVGIESKVSIADEALQKANEAAASMVVPVAEAANSVTGLGEELGKTGKAARASADDFSDLYERLFPEESAAMQLAADRALIQSNEKLTQSRKNELLAALEQERIRKRAGEFLGLQVENTKFGLLGGMDAVRSASLGFDATLGDSDFGAVGGFAKPFEEFDATLGKTAENAKSQTTVIAESFAQMSQRITSSLQGLANSIRSGDFLGILGGILDIFTTLGSAGVFGSGLQGRLNATPSNRSMGGPVYAGSPYIVGENGPELFTPPGSGRIVSNDNMAQNVNITVGIDPRSGNVLAFVDGRIAATGPVIANAGAQQAQAQAARSARRSVRR